MSTVIKANDEIRSIRAAAFNFDDMAVKAGQYLDKIRGEAAKILASAQKEAVAIRQRAEAEGRQAGQNAVEQTVQKQLARQLATLLPALQRAVEEVQHSRHAWLRHWEKSAVHTAAAIAARLVRRERIDHPEITVRLVREALELASGSSQLRLHLNPADHAALAPQIEAVLKEFSNLAPTELIADPRITPVGCRLDTRFGTIDQQFEAQLARIEEELT